MRLAIGRELWDLSQRSRILGVVNVTPDSFSDGGLFLDAAAAIAHGCALVADGADALDIGGESTRPSGQLYGEGRREVSVAEEIARVVPVLRGLRERVSVPLSIDTRKAPVAAAAIEAGACMVNDVSGGAFDPELLPLCARAGVTVALMHMRGTPETMASHTAYGAVSEDVARELRGRLDAALAAGIELERTVLDPGLGFAKTPAQSLALLAGLGPMLRIGRPLLVGASRKSFLGLGAPSEPRERVTQSVAAAVAAVLGGARLIRAHDVRETFRALRVADAVRAAGTGSPAVIFEPQLG